MPENLACKMEEIFPPELIEFLRTAADIAESRGEKLYLVGGAVRDLMLGKGTNDIDLVAEGDGIALARVLSKRIGVKATIHEQFKTAKLQWKGNWHIDVTTQRSETYSRPGVLPIVKPGSLRDDLFRRDFTVNAMALSLNTSNWGKVFDFYGGRADLKNKLIRILHEKSFIDDATRIWRAIRYATRLDFTIEEKTLELLKRDVPMFDTISGDRIRYELECVFREEAPEEVLSYAYRFGILQKIHPKLKAGRWLAIRFKKARQLDVPDRQVVTSFNNGESKGASPLVGGLGVSPKLPKSPKTGGFRGFNSVIKHTQALYFALLTYNLDKADVEKVIGFLRPEKAIATVLRDVPEIKEELSTLARPDLANSQLYHLLNGYSPAAIQAVSIAADSAVVSKRVNLYMKDLRHIKPSLTGEDLKKMGIPEGPKMKEILQKLLDARLDGKVGDRRDEEAMVERHGI